MEKKILFKIAPPIWPILPFEISIIKEYQKKNKIVIWACSGNKNIIKFCHANPKMNGIICMACKSKFNNAMRYIDKKNIDIFYDYLEENKNIKEIRTKKKIDDYFYNTIDIGKGVLSTLYSYLKYNLNLNKKFDFNLAKILIKESIRVFETYKYLLKRFRIDKIYVFNGRHYNYRPIIRYSKLNNLECYSYDFSNYANRILFFKNEYAHNLSVRAQFLKKMYELKKNKNCNQKIKNFFIKRFNEQNNNILNLNYNINQQELLPKNFNLTNFNIVYFNTSPWEFKAIQENEKLQIFSDEFSFLTYINKSFTKYPKIKIYYRCHPNLMKEKEYLNYIKKKIKNLQNVYFIEPASKIGSVNLIKNSNLVINYGSTVALEAAYLGKKVITLAPSIFLHFPFQTFVNSKKQLIKLIHKYYYLFKNKKLKFDYKANLYAQKAALALIHEGKKFDNVIVRDRFTQKIKIKNKFIMLRPNIFINFVYIFFSLLRISYSLLALLIFDFSQFMYIFKNYLNRFFKYFKQ